MNWQKWVGASACLILIGACFMNWTYYPDIKTHFSGMNTAVYSEAKGKVINYYGRPGMLLIPFAVICFALHFTSRMWAKWTNLLVAALCAAYAISRFFMFTNGYGNVIPEKEAGLFLMFGATILNLAMAIAAKV